MHKDRLYFIHEYFLKVISKILGFKYFRFIFPNIYNFLAKVVKPDYTIVLFGAMGGNWYGDNSYYLFEWVIKNRPDLKPMWITRSLLVYKKLKSENKPVSLVWGFKSFKYLMKARVGVFTNSLNDILLSPYMTHTKLNLIALRHGRSVKRVRFARLNHKISVEESSSREFEGGLIKYVISTSEFISELQEECLRVGIEKHIVTGYPRNDLLLDDSSYQTDLWNSYLDNLEVRTTILYAPSWRHGRTPTQFFPFSDFNEIELIEFLELHKILLLLRPHVGELSQPTLKDFLTSLSKKSSYIQFASHEVFPDVNTMLPFVDILISDYSALYHDYLLLDRPLLFIPYDYEEFKEKNGFLYDYYDNLPGVTVASMKTFLFEISDIIEGKDKYKNQRRKLCGKVHSYVDNKSSERVLIYIDKLLKEQYGNKY